MNIVEVIKKSFAQAPKLINIVLIFAVFNAVIGLISLPLSDPANAGKPGIIVASILSSILFFLVFILLQGGALGVVKDQVKSGSFNQSKFLEYGKNFYVRILSLLLLYILVAIAVVLVLSMISAGVLLMGDNIATRSIVAVIVTAAAISMITLLIYPIYVIVAEDSSTLDAFKKGVNTAKSNFLKTLGLFMGLLIISLLISLAIGFVTGVITAPLGGTIGQIIITIINAVVQSYISIVMIIAFMSFYLSLSGSGAPAGRIGQDV